MAGSVSRSGRSTPVSRTMNGVGCPALASWSRPRRVPSSPNSTVTKRSESGPKSGCSSRPVQLLERLAGARRPRELAAVHRGPQDVLGDERHGHRFDALAGHVADRERESARGAAVVVDEVAAAEHAGAGRAVREGDVETLQLR